MQMYKEYEFNGGKFHIDCGTCFFKMNDEEAQRKGDYFKAFKTVKLNREFCEMMTKHRLSEVA